MTLKSFVLVILSEIHQKIYVFERLNYCNNILALLLEQRLTLSNAFLPVQVWEVVLLMQPRH